MNSHAPTTYVCPICLAVDGVESDDTWIRQADIFYRDDFVMGFVSSKFVRGNEGHAIVVPLAHFENLYDLPEVYGHRVMDVSSRIAIAMKAARKCDGITIIQNNEPAGDQHAFHYHMHVYPRFDGDRFHEELMQAQLSEPGSRLIYANELRADFRELLKQIP